MKTLHTLCLESMARNFHGFTDRPLQLPAQVKEQLLHLIIQHGLLNPRSSRAITYNLISPGLRHLDLDRSLQVNDAFLTHIGMVRCEFVEIRIAKCGGISDSGLSELLINQNCLETLSLGQLQIKGTCLKSLNCPNTLTELCLKGCAGIEGSHVATVASRHRRIRKLTLKKIHNLSSDDLEAIALGTGEELRELDLSSIDNLEDRGILALADHCPKLESLKLSGSSKLSSNVLEHLLDCSTQLTTLELYYFGHSGGLSKGFVGSLPRQLESLTLFGLVQTDCPPQVWLESICSLTSLTRLNLSGFNLLSDDFLESILSSIGPQLVALDLSGSMGQLTETGIAGIAKHCTNGLESLAMNLMPGLSLDSLVPWIQTEETHSRLAELRLACCVDVCREFLWAVARHCTRLRSLDISGLKNTGVNNELIECLAETCGPNMEYISLRANQDVTDEGIVAFVLKAPSLQCCSLAGLKNVSDKSILAMANHCHHLKEVYLNGCSLISQQALNYLEDECIGRVTIYHLNPCRSNQVDYVVAKNLNTGEYCQLEIAGSITR